MASVEENASAYQVNLVSRMTGEGRAEFRRTWGLHFVQKGAGLEEGRKGRKRGGGAQSVRANYVFFKGDVCDGFGNNAPVHHVYPVRRLIITN